MAKFPAAVGEGSVAFAFHFKTSAADNWWTIDDVLVTADVRAGTDFRRGDAAGNGTVNISSAIFILSFLFTDAVDSMPCMDAGDINNDGSVNITDPVNLLNHLFGPQPPPAPPGLESCGPDPDEPGGRETSGASSTPAAERRSRHSAFVRLRVPAGSGNHAQIPVGNTYSMTAM